MTKTWQLQDAKARFSEVVDKAVSDGPQVVTRRGKETAVVLSVETWRDLERRARPTLKELLLAPEPKCDDLVPERGRNIRFRHRPPPNLDD